MALIPFYSTVSLFLFCSIVSSHIILSYHVSFNHFKIHIIRVSNININISKSMSEVIWLCHWLTFCNPLSVSSYLYPPLSISIYLSLYLPLSIFLSLSVSPYLYLPISIPNPLSLPPSLCLSISLLPSISLSLSLSLYISPSLSFSLPPFLFLSLSFYLQETMRYRRLDAKQIPKALLYIPGRVLHLVKSAKGDILDLMDPRPNRS